jgi:hypothetical protein
MVEHLASISPLTSLGCDWRSAAFSPDYDPSVSWAAQAMSSVPVGDDRAP